MIRTRIAAISGGTVVGQLFQFGSMVYLARVLAPAAFGPYSLFMGILAITPALGAMRYELAFGLAPRRTALFPTLLLVIIVAVLIGFLIALALLGVSHLWPGRPDALPIAGQRVLAILAWRGTSSLILGESLPFLRLRLGDHRSVARYSLLRP